MKKGLVAFISITIFAIFAAEKIDLDQINKLASDLKSTMSVDDEGMKAEELIEKEVQEPKESIEDSTDEEFSSLKESEPMDDESAEWQDETSHLPTEENSALAEMEETGESEDDSAALQSDLQSLTASAESAAADEDENEEEDDAIITYKTDKEKKEQKSEPILMADELSFDIEQKKKDVVTLVKMAQQELLDKPLDIACNRFSHTKEFIKGDLYVFVYDVHGTCIAHGDDSHMIWKNLYDLQDWVGSYIVRDIINTAKNGGGWVTYGWHNATKVAYVEMVEKYGQLYTIGAGYYPHSKEEAVVNLVKGGVALFNKTKEEGQPADWAFSRLSYPSGSFVAGNLYLYALDFNGKIKAQGERPGLINSNAWDYKDSNGKYVNREIVKKLQTSTKGVWVDYISKRAPKKAYAEKVKDKKGNNYFIACGYYPDADRERTIDLVRKGYQFMKTHGKSNSVEAFTSRRDDDFRYGDLTIMVYDLKGKVVADGDNADNIGRSMLDAKDEDGLPYIKNMLKRATKQGIWVNAKIKGSFESMFAQRIDLGVGQYVIASSYYPVSKSETMILLVQSAASYLKVNSRTVAFEQFVQTDGRFRRGDLEIIVVDTSGLCYVYGNDFDLIWRNIFDIKDEKGKPFIKAFINEAQQGPVVVKAYLNQAKKLNYVSSVEKDGKTYVIASGFYQ